MSIIEEKLKLLPSNPGVYVMLDKDGVIIYVGKAKNLKNRVRQYFFNSVKTQKVMAMVSHVADFYYIIAPSETEALSLENNLIKKNKPRYNILLKDDKTYPYIKVNLKSPYPTFKITRKILKDGAKYFGPFMGGISANDLLEMINLAFTVRPCDKSLTNVTPLKPCLNYHIKKCLAPCAKLVTEEEYLERVNGAVSFLNGNTADIERLLKEKMTLASEREEFELALKFREQLLSLEKLKLKRITNLKSFLDADVIAYSSNGLYSAINLLVIRKGRMVGSKNYAFDGVSEKQDAIREFILQYYKNKEMLPDEIIVNENLKDYDSVEQFLKKEFEKKVALINPKQGVRKQLIDMCEVNATEHLEVAFSKIKHKEDSTYLACERLKEILNLYRYPKRMECFDISNISGTNKVGSMVVFIDGEKEAKEYRRFKITSFEGADDFRSHQEVVSRRLERLRTDSEKFPKPDLIVIDGGKGQLSSVKEIFDKYNVTDIDLIALAERNEEIYTLNSAEPIVLERSDYALRLLQRIRDEAHRFAITFHRSLRDKGALESVLDGVQGLGKVRKKALIARFKDVGGILHATKEELMQVEGIGEKQSELIIRHLTKEGLL